LVVGMAVTIAIAAISVSAIRAAAVKPVPAKVPETAAKQHQPPSSVDEDLSDGMRRKRTERKDT
jgi:hypothetical protein